MSAARLPCFKCRNGAPFTPSRDGPQKPYCRACFVKYAESALRDAVYRQCGVPSGTQVVIAVSGSVSSVAVLATLAQIRDENASRGGAGKIDYTIHALHLSEASLSPDVEERAAASEACVRRACDQLRVPLTVLPLADLVDPAVLTTVNAATTATSSPALSDVEDAFALGKRSAILNAACSLGATGVAFGGSAGTCAWRGLSEVVRGRGAAVRDVCGYHGLLHVGPQRPLFLYRPARCLLAKELVLYLRCIEVAFSPLPLPAVMSPSSTSKRSIDRVLEQFVVAISESFRSTVFNVLNAIDAMGAAVLPGSVGSSTVTTAEGGRKGVKQHLHEMVARTLRLQDELRTTSGCTPCRCCGENTAVGTASVCYGCARIAALFSSGTPAAQDQSSFATP